MLIIASCKRDIAPPVVKCADDYLRSDLEKCPFVEDETIGAVYSSPTSNPNNPDEFAFVENGVFSEHFIWGSKGATVVCEAMMNSNTKKHTCAMETPSTTLISSEISVFLL